MIRRPSKRVLQGISDALNEIDAYFGFSSVSAGTPEDQAEEGQNGADQIEPEDVGEGDDDYGEYEEYEASQDYINREEIEIAVDAFLSALSNSGLIKKNRAGKLPHFGDVFEKFFGEDHDLAVKAWEFEEHTKGYFDWVSPEDMALARAAFLEIQESVEKNLTGSADEK